MQLFGKIIWASELKSGITHHGRPWRSKLYGLEFAEAGNRIPNKIVFNVVGQDIETFGIKVGEMLTVDIVFNVHVLENRKMANNIKCRGVFHYGETGTADEFADTYGAFAHDSMAGDDEVQDIPPVPAASRPAPTSFRPASAVKETEKRKAEAERKKEAEGDDYPLPF